MRAKSLHRSLLTWSAVLAGCTTSALPPSADNGATGAAGSANIGQSGSSTGAHGGAPSSGGAGSSGVSGNGGHGVGTSGAAANSAGGISGSGGARGGAAGNGGALATGGVSPSGGMGANPAGGATQGAGGAAPGAGRGGTGGLSMGGAAAGGASAAGGIAGSGMAGDSSTPMCTPGTHQTQGSMHCNNGDSGTADGNYSYNVYSSNQGTGCLTVYGVDATFSATWTNVGDWIGRVGLSFDTTKTYDKIGVFSSDFAYTTSGITTGGFGNVGIYGWSVNPLHEYYIIEDWLGKRPAFTNVGTLTIDGEGTYDIQTNMQKDQPNITGMNQDFVQFWSVRQTPRQCGHISISKHFDKWASLSMQLGNMEEARILVEAQNNSGSIDFTTGTVVVTQ